MLKKIIKGLEVFEKYNKTQYPFRLNHDAIIITNIKENDLSDKEIEIVNECGFVWNDDFKAYALEDGIT